MKSSMRTGFDIPSVIADKKPLFFPKQKHILDENRYTVR